MSGSTRSSLGPPLAKLERSDILRVSKTPPVRTRTSAAPMPRTLHGVRDRLGRHAPWLTSSGPIWWRG